MKPKLLTLVLLLPFIVKAQAPFVITQSNFNPAADNDTVVELTNYSSITVNTGSAQTWDYSNAPVGAESDNPAILPNNAGFPDADYQLVGYFESIIAGRGYNYDVMKGVDAGGIFTAGYYIPEQHNGIGDLTGNSADSFNVFEQNYVITPKAYTQSFPFQLGTIDTVLYSKEGSAYLTITALGYTNVVFTKKTNYTLYTEVVGEGNMRVPAAGGASIYYPVVMEKRIIVAVDSFYANGMAADAQTLGTFGLAQGTSSTSRRYQFWRADQKQPLAIVNYSDNFTTISSVFTDKRVQKAAGVGILDLITDELEVSTYPNPVMRGSNLNINFSKNDDSIWQIEILNALGQVITSKAVSSSAGMVNETVLMDNNFSGGLYFYNIVNNHGHVMSKGKVLVK